MDDRKVFAKKETEPKILIQIIRIYTQDIEMEFGFEKWGILKMKSVKEEKAEK